MILLGQVVKKSAWRGPPETGAQRMQGIFEHKCAKRQKSDIAGQKGNDSGKKIAGVKPHIGVDTQGLAHVVALIAPNIPDRK